MAGTHRHRQELNDLLAEVESSRRALTRGRTAQSGGFKRSQRLYPAVAAVAILVVAGGVMLALAAKSRRRRETAQARHWKAPDLSRFAPSWIQRPERNPQPDRVSQNVALARVIVEGVVELLKPSVTQVVTGKAAGSLGSAMASGLVKAVLAARKDV